ncbi:hypothetical protein [Micromonospora zamorensis]|uniref:hypothetical protein n=1 Tax=Micromonospora zamorensis TaxID=709883 RepID=UPI0037B9D353
MKAIEGAPDVVQAADRWHLLKKLSDTVEKFIRGHRRCLRRQTGPALAASNTAEAVRTGRRAAITANATRPCTLSAEGLSISAAVRRLDMNVRSAR